MQKCVTLGAEICLYQLCRVMSDRHNKQYYYSHQVSKTASILVSHFSSPDRN